MNKKLVTLAIACFILIPLQAEEKALFPEIQGWKMKVEDRVYNSGDLWELINGAADIFLSYYFQDLHIAEYTKKNQIIRVELYRHKTYEDAYGIFTAERMPDYPQVAVGALGYKSQGVLNFMSGYYYVKIMSAGVDEADEQTIALVASRVDDKLAQAKTIPEVVSLLPDEGKVYLSDTYIAQNFLGYSFFRNAFTARYERPTDFQLFIIRLTPEEIQQMVDQYIQMMKEDKVQQKDGYIVVNDLFNGTIFLKQSNNYLIGVVNTNDEKTAVDYINQVVSGIK